jgi:hypothetical protein
MFRSFRSVLYIAIAMVTLGVTGRSVHAGITYDIRFGQSNYNLVVGQSTVVDLYLYERYDGISGTGEHRIGGSNGLVFGNIGATITNSVPVGGSIFSADPVTGTGFDDPSSAGFRDSLDTRAWVTQGTNFGSPNVIGNLTTLPLGSFRQILLAQFEITAGAEGVDFLTPVDADGGSFIAGSFDDIVIDDGGTGFVIDTDPSLTFVASTVTISAVPEPSSIALIGVGALALGWRRMRRTKRVASE